LSGGEILATYHAEDHEGMPRLPSGIAGYYAAVGLALSRDQGETWSKLGPAITSAMPKEWSFYQDQGDRGAGESGALVTRDGRWWYVYYTEHSRRDGRGIVVCVARAAIDELTAGVAEPTSIANCFRKYHDGAFEQPGRGGLDTPVLSIAGDGGAFAMYPHPLWMPAFDRYAMLFNANHTAEHEGGQDPSKSGIHIAFSADALRWRSPTLLVADHGYPITGKSLSWEASLVFDRDDAGEGWLFYSYSPRWGRLGHPRLGRGGLRDPGGVPHHMVGRRLRIEPITSS
jgi:hypothetical protein